MLEPRGLSRDQAASYIGVSPSTFDKMQQEGLVPQPIQVGRRRIYDKRQIDECFDRLANRSPISSVANLQSATSASNPFDGITV